MDFDEDNYNPQTYLFESVNKIMTVQNDTSNLLDRSGHPMAKYYCDKYSYDNNGLQPFAVEPFNARSCLDNHRIRYRRKWNMIHIICVLLIVFFIYKMCSKNQLNNF